MSSALLCRSRAYRTHLVINICLAPAQRIADANFEWANLMLAGCNSTHTLRNRVAQGLPKLQLSSGTLTARLTAHIMAALAAPCTPGSLTFSRAVSSTQCLTASVRRMPRLCCDHAAACLRQRGHQLGNAWDRSSFQPASVSKEPVLVSSRILLLTYVSFSRAGLAVGRPQAAMHAANRGPRRGEQHAPCSASCSVLAVIRSTCGITVAHYSPSAGSSPVTFHFTSEDLACRSASHGLAARRCHSTASSPLTRDHGATACPSR